MNLLKKLWGMIYYVVGSERIRFGWNWKWRDSNPLVWVMKTCFNHSAIDASMNLLKKLWGMIYYVVDSEKSRFGWNWKWRDSNPLVWVMKTCFNHSAIDASNLKNIIFCRASSITPMHASLDRARWAIPEKLDSNWNLRRRRRRRRRRRTRRKPLAFWRP